MQSISQENFSQIVANICSYFVDKYDSKCYNKTPSSTLGGALYDLFQRFIRTGLLYLPSNKNNGCSPFSAILKLLILPFNSKEEMNRQEKQRKLNNLLDFLKATPNSDEYIDFVLQLAEESITMETLQNLIKNNATAQSDVKKQELDDISGFKFTNKEKHSEKNFVQTVVLRESARNQAVKTVTSTKYVTVEMDIIYPLPIRILRKRNGSFSNN